jgi:hypothetical protein
MDVKRKASVTPEKKFSDDDWSESADEPLYLLGQPKRILPLSGEIQNSGNNDSI